MDPFQSLEVVNRRGIPVEVQYSGICIVFQPDEKKNYPPNVAHAIVGRSAIRINAATGIIETYALGITGNNGYPTTPLDGELRMKNAVEVLDRRDVPKLTETEPKALSDEGEESLGVGKNKKSHLAPAPADEVKAMQFANPEVKQGPQNGPSFGGEFEGNRTKAVKGPKS